MAPEMKMMEQSADHNRITRVSVIVPAFNEAETIGPLVRDIRERYPEFEIIVVNDGSTDATVQEAKAAGATVISHPYNIGNGAAVKSGIRAAVGDILVFMDGDGQHSPADILHLLDEMPVYDMVVGARRFRGHASVGRAFGNIAYNWMASYVTKFQVMDLTSGFRAVKADIARNILYLLPNTYSYPTTMTLSVLRMGRSVKYVPVDVHRRHGGASKISLFRDGVRFFMIITRICTLFSPMRIFLPVSAAMFLLGALRYLYSYATQERFTNMSVVLFVTSILIFMMSLISEQICQMRAQGSEGDPSAPVNAPDDTHPPPDA